jgi:hypothetical protein
MDSPRDYMQSLPEGIEALRALVLTTMSERDAAATERDTLLAQNDRLRHLLLQLKRMHDGARALSGRPSLADHRRLWWQQWRAGATTEA